MLIYAHQLIVLQEIIVSVVNRPDCDWDIQFWADSESSDGDDSTEDDEISHMVNKRFEPEAEHLEYKYLSDRLKVKHF